MSEDEKAIRDLVATWMDATGRGDLETVLSLMADDVIFMVPGQAPFGKEAFAAASRSMRDMRFEGTAEVVELELFGDFAYLRNRISVTMAPEGDEGAVLKRSGYTLSILRKQKDGRWVLARDANFVA